jgi:hypothetical protein
LAPGDFVAVSDGLGGQSFFLEGQGKAGAGSFWAQRVVGETALVEYVVRGGGEKAGKGFVIDEYAAGFEDLWGDVAAICSANDKKNAICYQSSHPTEYGRARAVARLLIQGVSLCTGWLASADNHLITNEHCITSATQANDTDYEFGAEAATCASSNCQLCWPGTVYSGASLVRDSVSLDYALVQITSGDPAATFGFLPIDSRDAVVGETIYIPQHPGGRAKELGIESSDSFDGGVCRVKTITAAACTGSSSYSDVGYQCDTEGGSSGSPVLAASSHKVIALHHCANCPNRGVPIDLICAEICEIIGGGGCQTSADCNDGNPCTVDACNGGVCAYGSVACGPADGCCPAGCTGGGDPDCPTCATVGAACSQNSDCCSNRCRGRNGNRTCRG